MAWAICDCCDRVLSLPLELRKFAGLNTSGGLLTRCARELAVATGELGGLAVFVVDVAFLGRPRFLGRVGGWRTIATLLPEPEEDDSDPNTYPSHSFHCSFDCLLASCL